MLRPVGLRALIAGMCAVSITCPDLANATEPTVLVLPAAADGEVSRESLDLVEASVVDRLRESNRAFVLGEQACEDARCRAELVAGASADVALQIVVEPSGPDLLVRIIAHGADGEAMAVSVEDRCEICGNAELAELAGSLMGTLLPRLDKLELDPPRLIIRSNVEGAQVRVDDELVGTAPGSFEIEAGSRVIELQAEGYGTQRRRLDARDGVEETIQFTLTPSDDAASSGGDRRRIRPLWGGLTLGVGLGAVGAGVTMLALDGREHQPTCSDDVLDVDGRCPNVWTTQGAGIGLLVAGAAATAGGVTLLVLSRKRRGSDVARVRGQFGVSPRGGSFRLDF